MKEATTNKEKQILGIIDELRKDIAFGRITLELVITNSKIVLVEVQKTKKTIKLD